MRQGLLRWAHVIKAVQPLGTDGPRFERPGSGITAFESRRLLLVNRSSSDSAVDIFFAPRFASGMPIYGMGGHRSHCCRPAIAVYEALAGLLALQAAYVAPAISQAR